MLSSVDLMMPESQIAPAPTAIPARTGGRVLVKGVGGLGNRMLSLLTASLYAAAAERRLFVDWRDSIFTGRSSKCPNLFDDLFVSPIVDPLPESIDAQSVVPALWQGRLDETVAVVGRSHDPNFHNRFGSFRDLAVDLRRVDYADDALLVFWSWREVLRPLRPYLRRINNRCTGMSDWELLREAAKRYLHPCERVRIAVDQFIDKHFAPRMLGLHIRATDLVAPVEKLIRNAERTVRREGYEGVFCSTDNAEVAERARRALPNVVTLPKQMPPAGVPLHYDPAYGDRIERATQALTDMLLLSRCQCLVYAGRSSFGYVASILAPPGQVLVDVDRFNLRVRAKRYFKSWIY
jgi:hypothetical protein